MSPNARRLLLHRDLAELARLAVWLEGWAMRDLSADLSFAVQVCLEEAVANIIMYSATTDDRLEIVVEVERKDQTLVARIEDNGSAFDPTQAPPPPVPASLAKAKVGKLGIHLMRSFANSMHYERRDNRNRLTIRFVEEREGKVDADQGRGHGRLPDIRWFKFCYPSAQDAIRSNCPKEEKCKLLSASSGSWSRCW
jgi:serine/threonine-protein kinase RsbW